MPRNLKKTENAVFVAQIWYFGEVKTQLKGQTDTERAIVVSMSFRWEIANESD